jgi:hypothetical protein
MTRPERVAEPGSKAKVRHALDLPLASKRDGVSATDWARVLGQATALGVPTDARVLARQDGAGGYEAAFSWETTDALPPDDALPRLDSEPGTWVLIPGRVKIRVESGTWIVKDPRLVRLDPMEEQKGVIRA